jgi:uncharacterized membrane protein YhaH (DUF805 family)
MRSVDIFLSNDGRLDRERWLGAAACLILIMASIWAATWILSRAGVMIPTSRDKVRLFAWAVLVVMWVMLDWKRFQDRDLIGSFALICPGLQAVSYLLELPRVAAILPGHSAMVLFLGIVQCAVAVWYAIELGYRQGTDGYNTYGPDPRGPDRSVLIMRSAIDA